jgi:CheY-like chemotaxis protein
MPDGGELTIETANAKLDESYSAAHAEVAPGNYVVIAVTDTGQGMSKEVMARVFDPFFTTKEVGKGTGLGLSMVYGFVKQSGGHVKIYSEPGDGTTIKIYLPRLMSTEEDADEPARWQMERTGRAQPILVVEDDDDVRAYTVEILRELGYTVLEAHDGAAALRLLERREQKVDLLFTDVVMPEMSGRDLVERARDIRRNLKVLYTSGYTRNAIVHGGRLDAGVEIIAKPFTYQALAEKIADVLDTGRAGRILVVQNDPTLRMFTTEALEEQGFSIEEAATAAEALGLIRAAHGRYDAVFLDAAFLGTNGITLIIELRALHTDLPILVAVDPKEDQQFQRFANDRLVALVSKPYNASRRPYRRLMYKCADRGKSRSFRLARACRCVPNVTDRPLDRECRVAERAGADCQRYGLPHQSILSNCRDVLKGVAEAAKALGIEIHVLKASTEHEIDVVFASLASLRVDGVIVPNEPYLDSQRERITALAARYGVAALYNLRECVMVGGLASYGPSFPELYRRSAVYAGRVLKGERPADLPVQLPTKFEFLINLKAAKALGLTIPPTLLTRADEVIE